MPASNVLSLVIAVVFLLCGVTIAVFHAPFTRFARKMVSTLYGALGRRIAKPFTSELIATIGCFFIAFGVGGLACLALGSPMAPV